MATRSALRQYQLSGVHDTGRTVGNGSYATVKELEFCGLKCVGKKIHQALIVSASPREKAAMLGRFAEECQLLNRLHHPCVVQTLGVYFDHGSEIPVLVMEYLHSTLSACLERLESNIQFEKERIIAMVQLRNVTSGGQVNSARSNRSNTQFCVYHCHIMLLLLQVWHSS